jgi:hypothetical protein
MVTYIYAALLFLLLAVTVGISIAWMAIGIVAKAWWITIRVCMSAVMATARQWAEVRSAKAALRALSRTAVVDPGRACIE